ncbi:MAG: M23 family metallopeptidase, partial [Gemmatimonadales bacterium]
MLKLVGGAAVTLFFVALLFGYSTFTRASSINQADRVERQNVALISEIDLLHGRLAILSDTLSTIADRDERIRLLTNLEPNDPAVQQAGIGGPVLTNIARLSRDSLLPNNTGQVRVDLNQMIRRANLLAASYDEAADSLASNIARVKAMPSIMPTDGYITSSFSMLRMHPILNRARPHEGIDIMAPKGTPIHATAGGVVKAAGWESGYGRSVRIDHGFGMVTRYAHASKILVRRGQRVKRGQE